MSGTGNDFVVIDNRKKIVANELKHDFVRRICTPKSSIGADGVIFVENSNTADFRWDFYNADGSSAEMCGNGCRCVALYAHEHQIAGRTMVFETIAGVISAEVKGDSVKVHMTSPIDFRQDLELSLDGQPVRVDYLNTGVPHAIVYCDDVETQDLKTIGSTLRYHSVFAPTGANVNFVQTIDRKTLKIRTYERGVEGETLACGTGAVASAILAGRKGLVTPPVAVKIANGETLKIYFDGTPSNGSFGEVFLEGPAVTTFEGTIHDS
tara:strand:- start:2032 stop:2829 length:798 start_codon:yes stop_codon:yes gene_type:complete